MNAKRRIVFLGAGISVVMLGASPARAQLGQFLYRASEYINDRDFVDEPQGGPMFDNNIFEQRIEQNRSGDGYSFEFFRFFGPDSWDNPNTLDLGALTVQLGRDAAVTPSPQPVGIHNRIGYTNRVIPELFFESETGQRNFDIFSGQSAFVRTPVNYKISMHTGVQDFEWNGNMFVDASGRLNALGFYEFNLEAVNVGNYRADGTFVADEQVTDFDTGTIKTAGNIAADFISSIFQADGLDAFGIPTRILSGAAGSTSAIGKEKVEDIMARLEAGKHVTDEEMQSVVQEMLVTAFMDDPMGFMNNGMPEVVPGFEALAVEVSESTDPAVLEAAQNLDPSVPEPGTLGAMAILGLLSQTGPSLRRRRHRPA